MPSFSATRLAKVFKLIVGEASIISTLSLSLPKNLTLPLFLVIALSNILMLKSIRPKIPSSGFDAGR